MPVFQAVARLFIFGFNQCHLFRAVVCVFVCLVQPVSLVELSFIWLQPVSRDFRGVYCLSLLCDLDRLVQETDEAIKGKGL
jgi:hypothetical protein